MYNCQRSNHFSLKKYCKILPTVRKGKLVSFKGRDRSVILLPLKSLLLLHLLCNSASPKNFLNFLKNLIIRILCNPHTYLLIKYTNNWIDHRKFSIIEIIKTKLIFSERSTYYKAPPILNLIRLKEKQISIPFHLKH